MIQREKVLGLITARGGSKGIPGKNIKLVHGKPLMVWTIEAGLASKYIDRLILSSDDRAIMDTAKKHGCDVPFQRSKELAQDITPSIDVVLDSLNRCPGYDWVVLLQPTSPLRIARDIDDALEKCLRLGAPACVSICETRHSPYWMYTQKNDQLFPVIDNSLINRRQDLPKTYQLNGAVYVAKSDWLKKTKNFINSATVSLEMPRARSIDIDEEQDFKYFESLVLTNTEVKSATNQT